MKRLLGVALVAIGALFGIGVVSTIAETPANPDALPLALVCGVLTFLGATTLRSVEGPVVRSPRVRRILSTIFLAVGIVLSFAFLSIINEGSESPLGEASIPLYLALVFGGIGLGLRGTSAAGSFANNLAVYGVGAVVAMLLVVLFVFANSDDSENVPTEVLFLTMLLMLTSAGGVWLWSKRAVAPMAEITEVANQIQAGSLDRRIGLRTGTSEVKELADSFDQMLDRLSLASGTQQRMIEDASHELRTPLAALAINNEVALSAPDPSPEYYRSTIERSQALVERMQTTIDDLLAQGRSAQHQLQQVDNDLMGIVSRVADQQRVVNPEVPIAVRGPSELRLGIDGPSVQRAIENLVQNAVRYSPPGVPVEIGVAPGELEHLLTVTDHGPGIPPEERDAIFERYYQGDDADAGMAGIGLALVKQVADAHGGVEVTSPVSDEGGTRFTIRFRTDHADDAL